MNYRIIYNVLKHRILRFNKKDWRVISADGITSAEFSIMLLYNIFLLKIKLINI